MLASVLRGSESGMLLRSPQPNQAQRPHCPAGLGHSRMLGYDTSPSQDSQGKSCYGCPAKYNEAGPRNRHAGYDY